MTLSPTALEAARVAWLESASDYTRLDTSISAAITAYLAQREKEGFVEVPVEPERIVIDRAVAFALNVLLTGDYNWSAYMTDLYRRMIHAAAQNGGK